MGGGIRMSGKERKSKKKKSDDPELVTPQEEVWLGGTLAKMFMYSTGVAPENFSSSSPLVVVF